jgi:hypothetical protein
MSVAVVHSERLGADLRLGKLDAQPRRVGVKYEEDIRPELARAGLLPPVPQMFGHGHTLPQGKWMMLGNGPLMGEEGPMPDAWQAAKQGAGDCVIADCLHSLIEALLVAGKPLPEAVKWAEVAILLYMDRTKAANGTAYDPATGDGDTGLDIQATVDWLVQEGIEIDGTAHKIPEQGVFTLEPGNVQHLWEATYLTEKVKIGLVVCEAQMEQFDAGPQPTWDYVKGSPELGGHDTPVVGKLGLLSWAEDVYYTPEFIKQQCDEAIAVLHPEQFKSNGDDYEGFTEGDIVKWTVELAEEKKAQRLRELA